MLPYSYFFIETIYEEIVEMSSIYCKLGEEDFMSLLEIFIKIIQNLKIGDKSSGSSTSVET